jgi:hypothetical protein
MTDDAFDHQVQLAFDANDFDRIRELFATRIASGDPDALCNFGTVLTLSQDLDCHSEGIAILRGLADSGNGHAAHNLATALRTGPHGQSESAKLESRRYMQIAVDSGFEATVVTDPYWWRPA